MKTVPFSGIVLETSNPQDGQLTHMVNLRHTTTGSVEPVGDNPKVYTMHGQRTLLYIHKGNGYENWISYDGSTIYYEAYRYGDDTTVRPMYANDNDPSAIGVPIYTIKSRILSCTSVGNTLVIATQSEGILYFLCSLSDSGDTYTYTQVSIDEDDITVKINQTDTGRYGSVDIAFPYDVIEVGSKYVASKGETPDGVIYQKMAELKSVGEIQNASLIRWAVRMYDGTYILHSAPILFICRSPVLISGSMDNEYKDRHVQALFGYYRIKVDIAIPRPLKNSDIYKGIDVFMAEVPYYDDTDTYKNNLYLVEAGINYIFGGDPFYTDDTKLRERIVETSNFYRIAQYDFNSDKFNDSGQLTDYPDLSDILPNLVQQPRLSDDDYTHNTLLAENMFNYNSKIHISGVGQQLYKGYPVEMFISYAGSTVDVIKYISKTYIKTESGNSVVVRDQDIPNGGNLLLLSPYISYPDSRAYRMDLSISYRETGESGTKNIYTFNTSFDLTPHDFLNLAYYLPTGQINPIEVIGTEQSDLPVAPQPSNDIESTPNKIKVSATDNPFIFPVEQTYTIGNGKIIGMAAATPALSQGQYGQFPLYVFTDEGIYMMQVGSGEVVYTNVFPVSRDVCDNPDSILSLDNAVMFSSNNKIFILSGYSAKPISDPLEAEYIPNPGNLSNPYGNIISPYTKYAYNYQFAEIIVTPENSHISLIYDLNHKIWRERILIPNDYTIAQFVHSYPVAYAIDDYNFNVYDLSIEEKNNDKFKNIAIQTAPIVLGNTGFKKIERSVLRAIASGNITITIYASNDNISFYKMVATTVNTHNLVHDIPIPRIPSSWRYYYLCIEGDMGFKSTITRWDIQEKITFNTKLR